MAHNHILAPATAILAMIALSTTSCGSGQNPETSDSSATHTQRIENVIDSAGADTIANLLGTLVANDIVVDHTESDSTALDGEAIIQGISVALNEQNTSADFTYGVKAAQDLRRRIEEFRQAGIEINIPQLIKAIRTQLTADSIPDSTLARYNSTYNNLLQQIHQP